MVSGPPIQLPSGEKLLATAPASGNLDGRTLLADWASTRLGPPMPARSWFRRRANREYARAGRYTHFVVARKP